MFVTSIESKKGSFVSVVLTQNLTHPCICLETLLHSLYSMVINLLSMCFENGMKN